MTALNLYQVTLPESIGFGWDMYDSMVVCAPTAEVARQIHPRGNILNEGEWSPQTWIYPERISELIVVELGSALPSVLPGVVLASFNAG